MKSRGVLHESRCSQSALELIDLHTDFQHAQANAIWLGLEFRIKLFIKAQVSVGASICSAELTTVIVAVISSCSSSNYSLERQMRLLLFPAEDFSPW